jgi:chromosome segregation ATPase
MKMSELKEEIEELLCRVDELEEAKSYVEAAIDAIEMAEASLPQDISAPHSGITYDWESTLAEIEAELRTIARATEDLV